MADRYFLATPISADRVTLAGPEAHHLIHVMRAAPGIRVVLFDGSGAEFHAVVERIGRSEVELAILRREEVDRELPLDLTLGVALPKGDRQKWLVEKAVELGVTRLVPLRTERGVAQPVEQALSRLRRAVIEASKQCGRNRLMQIEEPQSWPDFAADAVTTPCRLLAEPAERGRSVDFSVPTEKPPHSTLDGRDTEIYGPTPFHRVLLAVGPEGGFAADEVARAVAAGWHTVDLGPRILRVETAALLLVAMVATRGKGVGP
jgi:16S rRNA (uracil1498-N3)-methyltransferase